MRRALVLTLAGLVGAALVVALAQRRRSPRVVAQPPAAAPEVELQVEEDADAPLHREGGVVSRYQRELDDDQARRHAAAERLKADPFNP